MNVWHRPLLLSLLLACLASAVFVADARAAGEWTIEVAHHNAYGAQGGVDPYTGSGTSFDAGSGANQYSIVLTNASVESATGATVTDRLPSGITLAATTRGSGSPVAGSGWSCTYPDTQEFICTTTSPLASGASYPPILARAHVSREAEGMLVDSVTAEGGGATASATDPTAIAKVPFGLQSLTTAVQDAAGHPFSQAGGHPQTAGATFVFNYVPDDLGGLKDAGGTPNDIVTRLPAGFVGNPQAITEVCPIAAYQSISISHYLGGVCPEKSIVGFAKISYNQGAIAGGVANPWGSLAHSNGVGLVYRLPTKIGTPATFGLIVPGAFTHVVLTAHVRSSGDYGLTLTSAGTPTPLPLGVALTFCDSGVELGSGPYLLGSYGNAACVLPSSPGAQAKPFLRNITTCSDVAPLTEMSVDTYEAPEGYASTGSYAVSPSAPPSFVGGPTSQAAPSGSPGVPGGSYVTGCEALAEAWTGHGSQPAEPSLTLQPEQTTADTPSGYSVDLHVPQTGLSEPEGLATADLDSTTVTLPQGVSLSPSAANDLQACSEDQIGYLGSEFASPNRIRFDESEPACPNASKIGTMEIVTPLLEKALHGSVYLAAQKANPFASTYAIYLAVDDAETGIVIKLAGKVVPDSQTGQLVTTFKESPQLPFEDFKLNFFGGSQASLVTPNTCGEYTTESQLTPWSAADPEHPTAAEIATSASSFTVQGGPNGGTCASTPQARPFAPALSAGTESSTAGAHSPFVLKLTRNDGEQEFASLDTTLPSGLTASLAGVPYCPDASIAAAAGRTGAAEKANPSCPVASQIGTVITSAGAGSNPYYVTGNAYLAGPYKGAPLSVAFITPAVAGPFDLGNVVVRAGLYVDPETAQVTVKTDPIPQILEGVPLQIRSIVAKIDRPNFTLNPTSCEPMSIATSISGSSGATASPSNRFQVGGCSPLPVQQNLKVQLKGATKRIGHPALRAVLTAKPGEANIARAQVNLPHGEFLDQGNLNKTCTKPVLMAGNCPASTVYGRARAWTPLLEKPLEGNVYLVGGYGYKLPALVAELNGQIRVLLVGKVDSGPNRGIRNTFEVVPDAPVSRFVLEMKGGKKYGLLENSENLCKTPKAKRRAIVRFTGHNNKVRQFKPVVQNQCPQKVKVTEVKWHGKKRGANGRARSRASSLVRRMRVGW